MCDTQWRLTNPMTPRSMHISVIVPAFNEEKLIGETLAHIQRAQEAFRTLGWTVELIVCDNNCTDRTAELARAAGARVVFEPVNQIARARNCAAAVATGDWLIFVDADSHPSPELFQAVAGQIQSGTCLAGGSTVTFEGYYPKAKLMMRTWNALSRSFRWLAGSFIFCDANAFRNMGGFSNELFASEELELSKRLKKLARAERKKIVILHQHPILTSTRKFHLYTRREHAWFMLRTILSGGRTLKNSKSCFTWYDGRR